MNRSRKSKQQQGEKQGKESEKNLQQFFYTVKKAGHSWRVLGIIAITGSHNTAAKQEIMKQHRGTDDRRLALKFQL